MPGRCKQFNSLIESVPRHANLAEHNSTIGTGEISRRATSGLPVIVDIGVDMGPQKRRGLARAFPDQVFGAEAEACPGFVD